MAVKTIARPASSAAAMTSSSRIEPPGWMIAVAPASAAARSPSAKGKNASDATTEPIAGLCAAPMSPPMRPGFQGGDGRAVDAAHLPGADANGRTVLGVNDRIGFDVLRDGPSKLQISDFPSGRRALRDNLQIAFAAHGRCRHPAQASRRPPGAPQGAQHADQAGLAVVRRRRFFLAAKTALASSVASGAITTSVKISRDRRGGVSVQRAVQCDDAAESRGAVAVKGASERFGKSSATRDTAWIGVLDDRDGRTILGREFSDQSEGRIRVVDIVVGQFFALMLYCGRKPCDVRAVSIKRRRLMRVFAVAQPLGQSPGEDPAARCRVLQGIRHPGRNSGVIGPSARVSRRRKTLAERIGGAVVGRKSRQGRRHNQRHRRPR